jgi:hypothetical protein
LCCQVEVSASGRSLDQRSPTDCGVCLSVIKWKENLHIHCEQVGRRGKDYERKRLVYNVYVKILNKLGELFLECAAVSERSVMGWPGFTGGSSNSFTCSRNTSPYDQ